MRASRPAIVTLLPTLVPTWTELVPWTDRKGRLHPLRAVVFALLLLPAVWLAIRWEANLLGPERTNAAIHSSGYATIWILLASLAVTPAKVLSGMPNFAVIRRMMGNAALLYAGLHLTLYCLDQHWRLLTIVAEIVKRFYLTIGFVALVGLAVLGFTSTDGWSRWLGRTWKQIHRVVYVLAVLGVIHYVLQSKLDVSQAMLAGGVLTWLLLWRALPTGPDRAWLPLFGLSLAAAVTTLVLEYLWYRFGTHANPMRVVASEFDLSFGLHPAGQVLLLGVLATAAAELRRLGLSDVGGTMLFTIGVYALGALGDDVAALFLGWSYDDILPSDTNRISFDVLWAILLGLVGLARWRLRAHPERRLFDALWVGCVAYQVILVGVGDRHVSAGVAVFIMSASMLLYGQTVPVSRGAAMMLLPLAVFMAYRFGTLL
jgi:sulfoxide reductase heme-binding subunit YedZ